jgi:hypothetical protein
MSVTLSLPNLPPAVARYTLFELTEGLPPPVTDMPEERAARDEAAIAAVADLRPANAFEARLAVRAVAADAQAMQCLRFAGQPGQPPEKAHGLRAQALAMMRASQGALRSLQGIQAARAKAAAAPALGEAREPADPPPVDVAAEADRFAQRHRRQAALIRRLGHMPDGAGHDALPPALVQAIVTGTSPNLRALDRMSRHLQAEAA